MSLLNKELGGYRSTTCIQNDKRPRKTVQKQIQMSPTLCGTHIWYRLIMMLSWYTSSQQPVGYKIICNRISIYFSLHMQLVGHADCVPGKYYENYKFSHTAQESATKKTYGRWLCMILMITEHIPFNTHIHMYAFLVLYRYIIFGEFIVINYQYLEGCCTITKSAPWQPHHHVETLIMLSAHQADIIYWGALQSIQCWIYLHVQQPNIFRKMIKLSLSLIYLNNKLFYYNNLNTGI